MASLLTPNPTKSGDSQASTTSRKAAAIDAAAGRLSEAPAKKAEAKEPEKPKEGAKTEAKPGMLDAKLLAVARQKFLDRDKKKSKDS
jgi:hypothetical protein